MAVQGRREALSPPTPHSARVAIGLLRCPPGEDEAERNRIRVRMSVMARHHGFDLVEILELEPSPLPGTDHSSCRQASGREHSVLDRMVDLAAEHGARTVLTRGPVDCPGLEDGLLWSGLRACATERWEPPEDDAVWFTTVLPSERM